MAKKNEKATSAGETMMNALKRRGKPMTTEALAELAGLSVKDAYSRLWWLQKKEGLLKSTGRGKERQWTFSARGIKSMAPPAEG
jgi:predicted HTH transcriptional regulator